MGMGLRVEIRRYKPHESVNVQNGDLVCAGNVCSRCGTLRWATVRLSQNTVRLGWMGLNQKIWVTVFVQIQFLGL